MSFITRLIGWMMTLFLLLAVLTVMFVAKFDWNRLKPIINEKASQVLQRPFAIRGDLGVRWQQQSTETGWRRWVPWPYVHARDIILGNPPDFPGRTMAHIQRVDATLAPLSLLQKQIYLPWIKVQAPQVMLIQKANKKNNWTFSLADDDKKKAGQPASPWSFRLDTLRFDRGDITLQDAVNKANIRIEVNPLGKPVAYAQVVGSGEDLRHAGDFIFGWKAHGSWRNAPLEGEGRIGGMLSLRSKTTPFPIEADIRNGTTRVQLTGKLHNVMALSGFTLRLRFSGDTLANLYDLTGIILPDTPPYETDGIVQAQLAKKGGAVFHYQHFNGRIGDSDIHGSLTFRQQKPRPMLSGTLRSAQLRMADLGPLIGANTGKGSEKTVEAKEKRGDAAVQPAGKVLPYDRFDTQSWQKMDADIRFTGKRIVHGSSLPLSDLFTQLTLKAGKLRLEPLRFSMAGGTLNAFIDLNGDRSPMQGRAELHARGLRLQQLFPNVGEMQDSLGQLNGDARLDGRGNSVASLLADSNGSLTLLMNSGVISRNLMEIIGLNVGNYLVGQLFGDKPVPINCAAASVVVENGLASTRLFLFDTENAVIHVSGTANFGTEQLDLTINPQSKGIRIITLRSPLYVRGTFGAPQAGVKPVPLIARGAAAIVLGAVAAPAAALLALISPSDNNDNQCTGVLQSLSRSTPPPDGSSAAAP